MVAVIPIAKLADTLNVEPRGALESTNDYLVRATLVYDVEARQTADSFWVVTFSTGDGKEWQAGFERGSGLWAFTPYDPEAKTTNTALLQEKSLPKRWEHHDRFVKEELIDGIEGLIRRAWGEMQLNRRDASAFGDEMDTYSRGSTEWVRANENWAGRLRRKNESRYWLRSLLAVRAEALGHTPWFYRSYDLPEWAKNFRKAG